MLVTTASSVLRVVEGVLRRADAHLARGAARNAADGIAAGRARRLDDVRTLRDLHRLEVTARLRTGGTGRP